jgi:protoheme IX farnesyltransferase
VTIESIVLFLIIFLWTPAHFWALALFKMRDYEAVGVPMLPNVSGERVTKHNIVAYAVLTAICAVIPSFLGFASIGYGFVAAPLGIVFVYCSIAVWRMPDGDEKMVPAKKMFAFSIFYLFAIFSALMFDRLASVLVSHTGGLF